MINIRFLATVLAVLLPCVAGAQRACLPETGKLVADSTRLPHRISSPGTASLLKPAPFRVDHYKHLGIACKAEYKLEKATGLPLRIRLGSLQQTDYLESKPNARKLER